LKGCAENGFHWARRKVMQGSLSMSGVTFSCTTLYVNLLKTKTHCIWTQFQQTNSFYHFQRT